MGEIIVQQLSELSLSPKVKSSTDFEIKYDPDATLTKLTVITCLRDNCKDSNESKCVKLESNTLEAVIQPVKSEENDDEGLIRCDITSVPEQPVKPDPTLLLEEPIDGGGSQNKKHLPRGPSKQKKARVEGEYSNCLVPGDSFSSTDQPVISPHLYESHSISPDVNNGSVLGKHTLVEWKLNNQQINGTNHYGEFTAVTVNDVRSNVFNFNSNQQRSNFNYTFVTSVNNSEHSPASQYQQTYFIENNENPGYPDYQQPYVSNSQIDVADSCFQNNYLAYDNNSYPVTLAEATYTGPPQHFQSQSYYNICDSNNYYGTPCTQPVNNFADVETMFGNLFSDTNELSADYFSSGEMPILSGLEVDSVMAELDQQIFNGNSVAPFTVPQSVSYSSSSNMAMPAVMSQRGTSEIIKKSSKASAQSASHVSSILPQIPITVASVSMHSDEHSSEQELPVISQCVGKDAQVKCVGSANKTLQQLPTHRSSPVHQTAAQSVPASTACNNMQETSSNGHDIASLVSIEELSITDVAQLTTEQLLCHNKATGNTLLHDQVQIQNIAAVKALLERIQVEELTGEVINRKNFLNQTAAYLAVVVNNASIVALLIEAGADINIATNQKSLRYASTSEITVTFPLHYAAERGVKWLKTLRAILAAKNINIMGKNHRRQTALHVAVESHGKYEDVDCRDAILLLHQYGLKLMDQDGSGKTSLYYAVEKRNSNLLAFLLESVSAEDVAAAINVRMSNGATCLHVAAGLRDLADSKATEEQCKIVQLLLDNGADWKLRIGNQTKSKPADFALNPRIKKLILQFGKRVAIAARNLSASSSSPE